MDWFKEIQPIQCMAPITICLPFLQSYFIFLNLVKEALGWMKQEINQGQPKNFKEIFEIIHTAFQNPRDDITCNFYLHTDFYLAQFVAYKPIKKIHL